MDTQNTPSRALPDVRRQPKRRAPRAEKHLTVNETRVLAILREGAGEAPKIAKAVGVQGRSIYVILRRLSDKGLVRRQAPGWYELIPPKAFQGPALKAALAPSTLAPIPLHRLMGGR